MVVKSRGIVLNYIKHGDTSIIARIFTEAYGYGSYLINSVRSSRSKKSIGYFQPFSILDLVLYFKKSREVQRVSEFKHHIVLHSIYCDIYKSTITLFLSEVFSKLLQSERSPNASLYAFAESSIHAFDQLRQGSSNFHIQFLLKLASYLGFEIENAASLFSSADRLMPSEEGPRLLQKMLKNPYGSPYDLDRSVRREMINAVLSFYEHHLHLSTPKSLKVIRSILD